MCCRWPKCRSTRGKSTCGAASTSGISSQIQRVKGEEALLEQAKVEGDGMYRFCTHTHKPFFDHLTRLEAGIREFRNVLEMIEVKRRIMEGADEATLLGGFKSRLLEQYSQSASKSSSSSKESKKGRK